MIIVNMLCMPFGQESCYWLFKVYFICYTQN